MMKGKSLVNFLLIVLALFITLILGCEGADELSIDPTGADESEEVELEPEPAIVRVEKTLIRVDPDPEKGFYWPYFLSIPTDIQVPEGTPTYLFVEPNNTGFNSNDFQVHENSAREEASGGWAWSVARDLAVPLVVPTFPRPPHEKIYTQALNRETIQIQTGDLARIDLQLLAMIDDAQEQLREMGLTVHHQVLMNGYSASGVFVNRFTALHPERVRAVSAGGVTSLPILPVESWEGETLTFPFGVGDLETLIGKPFDYGEYIKVSQFIYLGGEDPQVAEDLARYNGHYTRTQAAQIWNLFGRDAWSRWGQYQNIYVEQEANVTFKTYKGLGHEINQDIHNDVVAFFQEVIGNNRTNGNRIAYLDPSDIRPGVPTKVRLVIADPSLVSPSNSVRIAVQAKSGPIPDPMLSGVTGLTRVVEETEGRFFEYGYLALKKEGSKWVGELTITLPNNLHRVSIRATEESREEYSLIGAPVN